MLDGDRIAAYLLGTSGRRRGRHRRAGGVLRPGRHAAAVPAARARRPAGGRSLAAARDEGYAHAALTVDSGNPTGALGLYERAGFTVDHESVTWAKTVG